MYANTPAQQWPVPVVYSYRGLYFSDMRVILEDSGLSEKKNQNQKPVGQYLL